MFCFFPANLCHPHTQIRKTLFHGVRISIPDCKPFHNCVAIWFPQSAFLITVLPKDVHRDFAQGDRLGLPYWTMFLAICVVVDESKCLDIPIWEFSIIVKHLPFYLGISRYCVRCLSYAPWQSGNDIHGFLLLSLVMLMILVQWIPHKTQNHLSQYRLGVQLELCIFGVLPPVLHFSNDMSISEAKWTFAPFVLASSITSFLLLTFVRFHAGIFSNFSHSLSTAAFAAGTFMAWDIGINLCTKLKCCSEISPFPAIWSSWWFGNDSPIRNRVDSLASKIHANFDLKSLVLLPVSPFLLFLLVLQGIAGTTGVSNFLRALSTVSLNFSSSGSMK